jgi:hypothetical protein
MPERAEGEPYRFTWNTPIHISPHNSQILYTGGQYLLRSLDRGDHWEEISPDLTTNDPVKIAGRGHIQYCTITTISESPVRPGVLWVGTDDGRVHVTRNHGADWTELTGRIHELGGPEEYWVSRVHASSTDAETAYVTKSGYRRDDFHPFVFKTMDYGETWSKIAEGLPERPVNVIFEDRKNPNLIFLGNDMGIYVSIDAGKRWVAMKGNMPTVPVHDLVIHPRENDLVAGTYGRSIWIADVTVVQEMNDELLGKDAHLFEIEPKPAREMKAWGNYELYGDRHITTPNDPVGLVINYYLKEKVGRSVTLSVSDPYGTEITKLEATTEPGLNQVFWNFDDEEKKKVSPGEYVVTLELGDERLSKRARVR